MQVLDYIVLGGYFVAMIAIGIWCSLRIKKQEDFFMGGRGFGKLLQTFAAFGAGTGSQDPITVGRTTWTSGLSGIWSALLWLFVTPFYWITAVWYRRMRHLTLADWWVERYESKPIGVAYCLFAFVFQILYLSTMFSAISKVAQPLLGTEAVLALTKLIGSTDPGDLRFTLVPTIAVVVVVYGVLGGLAAAYWTDLIQGLCIILLSVILIPAGLSQLVTQFGDQYQVAGTGDPVSGLSNGFSIMHERLSSDYFQLFGGPSSGEFPPHYIIALTMLGLIGIVVQPHFIATGGGSAKSENAARIGLVTGNFLKRACTIGWAITALVALALLAGDMQTVQDPDEIWGIATERLLAPLGVGLVGLMLACLLAAMMSSADCYMLIASALFVRNIYAAYFVPKASEAQYVFVGRLMSFLIVFGAASMAIFFNDVFKQYVLSLEFAAMFGAPFWLGIWWRRASTGGAWLTVSVSLTLFFVLPALAPMIYPPLVDNPAYTRTTDVVTKVTHRLATPVDAERRQAEIDYWDHSQVALQAAKEEFSRTRWILDVDSVSEGDRLPTEADVASYQKALAGLKTAKAAIKGPRPEPVVTGQPYEHVLKFGGNPIFWTSLKTIDSKGNQQEGEPVETENSNGNVVVTTRAEPRGVFQGEGSFDFTLAAYDGLGFDLTNVTKPTLVTLRYIPLLSLPFILMVVFSLMTPPNSEAGLNRYYAKMRTPVLPEPDEDVKELEKSYAQPHRFESKRLFKFWGLEIQKPSLFDVGGFFASVAICLVFLAVAWWLANLGAF
ncbi:sodium:solute symporter family protein [Lignipirellula cremea]|uniref:Sodium/proline symporter n=1 Tax=Lignipirellula cremea TaxID=2528010 RepID=A0A518DLJ0_9BACT|nr:sodium:solute symporter family protein [Lignipirellula cremea]QDU92695.1 Sodium/proline symporter [Lignipirellula cremea]